MSISTSMCILLAWDRTYLRVSSYMPGAQRLFSHGVNRHEQDLRSLLTGDVRWLPGLEPPLTPPFILPPSPSEELARGTWKVLTTALCPA